MLKFQDRHIVVTGASSGIGAQLCRQLARRGCRLTLAARREGPLGEVAAELRALGGQAAVMPCDATVREQVLELAARATANFGQIDIWVSNAGAGICHRLLEATEEDMLAQYRLNCLSALWGYQAVLPSWIKRGWGQIIDICSLGGKCGYPYAGGYAAAKHGMSAIGDTMRQELALLGLAPGPSFGYDASRLQGIVVTTVYPGVTASNFGQARLNRAGLPPEVASGQEAAGKRNPLARLITQRQSAEYVARRIVGVMFRPVYTLYPHPGGTLGVLMNNFNPGLVLRVMSRAVKR